MRRTLYRLSAIVLAALMAAVAIVPSPASAAPAGTNEFRGEIPCPNDPNIRWTRTLVFYFGYQYSNINATSTFFASDGRTVENQLDQTISANFTSSQTRTTTVTTEFGTSSQLAEKLQLTVSTSIVMTRTTAIGVNATLDVPPRTRTTGLYGIHGYFVTYAALRILKYKNKCYVGDNPVPVPAATNAPTFVEGWQFSSVAI
jgi:hypothetical protein